MFNGMLPFFPFLVFLIWLGVVVYVLVLATRLVHAVEQIARTTTARPPDSSRL